MDLNCYVRLKEGFDETDLYMRVESGATGWVRDMKDEDGFPMIFIEWDETNPKYAGEIDKWVFENHFEVLSSQRDKQHNAERYIESIRIATDSALMSQGFVMIAMSKNSVNGQTIYEPLIFSGELSEEAGLMLEAQIAYMASTLLHDYIKSTLDNIKVDKKHKDDDESGR